MLAVAAAVATLVVVAQPLVSASAAVYQRTVRVNLSSTGAEANIDFNGQFQWPALSAHGRYVAFASTASNLVPADTNDTSDVFVRDVATRKTRQVGVSSTGAQGNAESGGGGGSAAINADGRYIVFASAASNLVPGDTNGTSDVFVRDVSTGKTRRVSVSSAGAQATGEFGSLGSGGTISADGRHVAIGSDATNLVPGDTNNMHDVFVHDMATGKTRRVSVSSTGAQSNDGGWSPAISADGQHIAFSTYAPNLVPGDTNNNTDVFVHDMTTGQTRRVSVSSTGAQSNEDSNGAAISADGRRIAFYAGIPLPTLTSVARQQRSSGAGLVPGDTNAAFDVFVHDMTTGQTRRVSVSSTGAQGNSHSRYPAISADGRHVAFSSNASNLVAGDTNDSPDVFLRHLAS